MVLTGKNETCLGLHVKGTTFLPDLKELWNFSTDIHKSIQYQISAESIRWEPR
jgi:hypothetical protein